jgi:HK97 family phage portal protein
MSRSISSPIEPGGGWVGALKGAVSLLADQATRSLARRSMPGTEFPFGGSFHVAGTDTIYVTMGPDGLYQWYMDGETGWRNSAVAYRCIVAIATNAATCPLEILNDGGEAVPNEVADLWNHAPNEYMSARVLREISWLRLETRGQTFIYMDRGNSGRGPVSALHVLDQSWAIEPVIDNTGPEDTQTLIGYHVHGSSGRTGFLLPEEMLWLRYPDPDDVWAALPPLRAARFALELDDYARRYQSATLQRGGTPGGVVYLGDVDEHTHKQVRADLQARHESPENAGRHLVLSGPVPAKYDRIGLTSEEVSYLDTRVRTAEEVMLAFGVPRDYLMGGTTYENRDAARTTLWSDTIVPKLQVVASEIDLVVVPDPTQTAQFNVDEVEALQESADARHGRLVTLVQNDIVTIDEAREEIGQEPLPDSIGTVTLTVYRARANSIGSHQLPDIKGETPPALQGENPFGKSAPDPGAPTDDNPTDEDRSRQNGHRLPIGSAT